MMQNGKEAIIKFKFWLKTVLLLQTAIYIQTSTNIIPQFLKYDVLTVMGERGVNIFIN